MLEQRAEKRTRDRVRAWQLAHDFTVVVAADGTIEIVDAGFVEFVAAGRNGVLDSGMQVLMKPFTVDALATKVREIIRGVQAG